MPINTSLMFISVILPLFLLSSAAHNRRILHQPFFPLDSQPPNSPSSTSTLSSPPPPPPTTVPGAPFFPSTPLSPSPPSLVSFPANVSSLIIPHDSKSTRSSSKLAVVAIAAVVSAVIVMSIAVYLHLRKRRNRALTDSKTQRSDISSRINYAGSARENIPKLERPSQTSSEFLYLGTLVDSYGGIATNGSTNHRQNTHVDSTVPNSRKLDSPDLRLMSPLRQQSISSTYGNTELGSGGHDDDEEEVFYSPRGSLGGKNSSIGTGSFSGRVYSAVDLEKVGSSSSFLSSSSVSASPVRSVSRSISPRVSFSPKEFRRKSPEMIAAQAPPFRPPPPPPPPPVPFFRVPLVERKESQSPSFSPTLSPSPPSSTSPERVYSRSRDTSPETSCCSNDENLDTSQLIDSPPRRHVPPVPPPPPPPPSLPFKNRASQRTPKARELVSKPPVSVAPLISMSVESVPLILPSLLPSNLKGDEKDEKAVDSRVDSDDNEEVSKPKLKPLHWDKVRASSGREMVWDQLKSSSFKLNEEMIETLFVAKAPPIQAPKEATRWQVLPLPTQENRVLDPKKSQNIAILLRALNVTVDEVCDSLLEGSADYLGPELLESLLKMAPTKEEERKLREYKDDSPVKLGPAEKFLKAVLDIPFAFKRVEALLYVSNFESEIDYLKNSFQTLELACEELRNSRMFLKLLEAVLKTGNRMNVGTNRGDAHAFKLDTLLKLVDIKGADGKTTLLHFVVQEIIRSEGVRIHSANKTTGSSVNDDIKCRKLGLQVVSSIGSELENIKKAAAMDSEVLHNDVLKLSNGLGNITEILRLVSTTTAAAEEEGLKTKFSESVAEFMIVAEDQIIKLRAQESVALTLVKEITEYFHGNSTKEEAHPLRIFMVVRDFLTILDRVCKEVGSINERTTVSSAHKFPIPVNPTSQQVPGGGFSTRQLNSSSDDDSS